MKRDRWLGSWPPEVHLSQETQWELGAGEPSEVSGPSLPHQAERGRGVSKPDPAQMSAEGSGISLVEVPLLRDMVVEKRELD